MPTTPFSFIIFLLRSLLLILSLLFFFFFFFNDTATTEIYTLSLHDALPILRLPLPSMPSMAMSFPGAVIFSVTAVRSEEHTSELQSRLHLVCRLLLEKKKKIIYLF